MSGGDSPVAPADLYELYESAASMLCLLASANERGERLSEQQIEAAQYLAVELWALPSRPTDSPPTASRPTDSEAATPDLDAIEARAKGASVGPWSRFEDQPGYVYCDDQLGSAVAQCRLSSTMAITNEMAQRNAEFIAHARADIPALIAEVRRLRAGSVDRAPSPATRLNDCPKCARLVRCECLRPDFATTPPSVPSDGIQAATKRLAEALDAARRGAPSPATPPQSVKWLVGPRGESHRRVCVEEREQRDGTVLYAVTQQGCVLDRHDLQWEFEPQPSSRDDDFIDRTRFTSLDEAFRAAARAAVGATPTEGA